MSTPSATSTLTTAFGDAGDDMLTVAGVGLGVGVTLFVLRKGWRLLKGFTS